MNARTSAAATHLVCGGLTCLLAVKSLFKGKEHSYGTVWNEFLFQYGGALTGLVVGAALIGAGFLTLRAKDPAANTTELNFIYEAEIPLAPLAAAFLMWIAIGSSTAILPYTGERGIVPGQLGVVFVLIPMLSFGAWFLLHYRRLAILDGASGTLQIIYGKPWAALRLRSAFSDYQSVSIQEVERARGSIYRLVATGPKKGSKMITFCFSQDAAKECLANIAKVTGWSTGEVPALKSA